MTFRSLGRYKGLLNHCYQLQYYKDRHGGALALHTPFWTSTQYLARMEDLLLALGLGATMIAIMHQLYSGPLPSAYEVVPATESPGCMT